jgi:hypothetical protein
MLSNAFADKPLIQDSPNVQAVLGPFTHENLTVFLIQGRDESGGQKYLTLAEALDQKKVVVHETGNVNELTIENVSDDPVYIQSGEIVKGGRQDRTLGTDMILTKSMGTTPIASFCVEHGRWTGREGEASSYFATSDAMVVGGSMKLAANANSSGANQSRVWESVAMQQQKLSDNVKANVQSTTSPSSFELTLESKPLNDKSDEYETALIKALDNQHDIVGWAYAVNGKIVGANVYSSPDLFKKLWPKLLKSACVEAIADLPKTAPTTQPTVAAGDVGKFFDEAAKPKPVAKDVNDRTRVLNYGQDKLEMLECQDRDGTWVHRNYLTKEHVVQPETKQGNVEFDGPQINAPARPR